MCRNTERNWNIGHLHHKIILSDNDKTVDNLSDITIRWDLDMWNVAKTFDYSVQNVEVERETERNMRRESVYMNGIHGGSLMKDNENIRMTALMCRESSCNHSSMAKGGKLIRMRMRVCVRIRWIPKCFLVVISTLNRSSSCKSHSGTTVNCVASELNP